MRKYTCDFSFSTSKLCHFLQASKGYHDAIRLHCCFPVSGIIFFSCFQDFFFFPFESDVFVYGYPIFSPQDAVSSASSVCRFMSFAKLGKFQNHYLFKYFFSPTIFFLSSGIPRRQILDFRVL